MAAFVTTRTELTAAGLRGAAARSRDAQAARRMLALALVLEGVNWKTATETCGMDRQTLRDWVYRYNTEGLAGLSNQRGLARRPRLDRGQTAELAAWLEADPDPAVDGVVRWRRQDLKHRIMERFGVELHERTVSKYLTAPDTGGCPCGRVTRRPTRRRRRRPENFAGAVAEAIPETAQGKPLEV